MSGGQRTRAALAGAFFARPDFLLQPGELLQACAGLHVVAYENGFCDHPERFVQRITALRKRPSDASVPARHLLPD